MTRSLCSFLRELEAAKFKAKVLTEPVSARILLTPLCGQMSSHGRSFGT